ncbi:Lsr2 family protein [Arthrobacter sp. FW306-05-C]|uniref:histone-like nucleoid-structuring protein Lsr2 n=1 Tax=Arthrobacter sp. FW306-05-C TaxID=2879620 RepID=UPI001F1A1E80|nr:Lsr2 family protein [Arthrobacter sp. FW306-05-C]UKA68358.1 Lsr2 family protein [Arthrobacter sp. FW306-05-C]
MAQKTVVILSDDIDGSEANETITFGLDGSEYEIDLNEAHASELRSALERFAHAGRRISGGRRRPTERKSGGSGVDTKAVRMWALDNGLKVNTRGRIQQEILEKYQAAH